MSNPNFAQVVLQLACDGTNGSTSFPDASTSAKTVSVFGNTQVSTAQSKFGGASARFDGTGDYLSLANSTDWDVSGDYTVEFWFRTDVSSGASFTRGIVGTGTFSSSAGWCVGHYLGSLYVRINSTLYSGAGSIATNTWYHVALVWNGSSFKVYLDGVEIYNGTAATVDTSNALIWGNVSPIDANRYLQGYVDDVRIHKGFAFYTAAFTPPAAAHSTDRAGWVALAGPLQPALVLGSLTVDGYGSAAGPLGAVLAQGGHLFGSIAVPGPLGAPRVRGVLQFAWSSAAGPLSAPRVRATHDFTAVVAGLRSLYVMDLVTPGGDVRAPISSWQATLRNGASNFVQCNIPACEPFAEDIAEATEFVVSRRVELPSGGAVEYEMARADVDNFSLAQGPRNYTATLTGFSTGFAEDETPAEALDRDLEDVRSVTSASSGLRVRCGVDWLLRPGMRARLNDVPFVVDRISYFVSTGDAYMDVSEVE